MIERLVLVRHGETVHNVSGITQGWSDSELSERGWTQVRAIGRRLVSLEPTAIYSSTLARALSTAEVIGSELGLAVTQLDDLREMNCGEWEGVPFLSVREAEPELFRQWSSDPTVACPGGESYHDVQLRMERAVAWIEEQAGAHGRAVVVSHGTAIRIVATSLLKLSLGDARAFVQDNAAINVFERRGGRYVLARWNDTSHWELNGQHDS